MISAIDAVDGSRAGIEMCRIALSFDDLPESADGNNLEVRTTRPSVSAPIGNQDVISFSTIVV